MARLGRQCLRRGGRTGNTRGDRFPRWKSLRRKRLPRRKTGIRRERLQSRRSDLLPNWRKDNRYLQNHRGRQANARSLEGRRGDHETNPTGSKLVVFFVLSREGVFDEHTEMELHEGPARPWRRL